MKWATAVTIVAVVALIVGGFIAWMVFKLPSERCASDPIICACAVVLPDKRVGGVDLKVGPDQTVEIDVGAVSDTTGAAPEQIQAWIDCFTKNGTPFRIVEGVRLPQEPIGQVANRWRREAGLKVDLGPESNEVLQNLRIGPAVGTKTAVIEEWCRDAVNTCVTCEPQDWADMNIEVRVRLKEEAPVSKIQVAGKWPYPASEPWQIVEPNGDRFIYECKPDQ